MKTATLLIVTGLALAPPCVHAGEAHWFSLGDGCAPIQEATPEEFKANAGLGRRVRMRQTSAGIYAFVADNPILGTPPLGFELFDNQDRCEAERLKMQLH